MAGGDHFQTGGDGASAQDIVLADDHVFEALFFPEIGDVLGYFVVMHRSRGMRDGSEIAMLLANLLGGDESFEFISQQGLLRGVQRREAGDFCCGRSAEDSGKLLITNYHHGEAQ